MADQKTLIRIMGESDIVDVTMTRKAASHALLMGLDAADKVNLLGHWMDQDRGAELAADQNHLDAMTIIASEIIASEKMRWKHNMTLIKKMWKQFVSFITLLLIGVWSFSFLFLILYLSIFLIFIWMFIRLLGFTVGNRETNHTNLFSKESKTTKK